MSPLTLRLTCLAAFCKQLDSMLLVGRFRLLLRWAAAVESDGRSQGPTISGSGPCW